jgi:hypothetical protein
MIAEIGTRAWHVSNTLPLILTRKEPSRSDGVSTAFNWGCPMPNAQYWRDRAVEALRQAAEMHDAWFRWQLLQIAVGYEHLAQRALAGTDAPTGERDDAAAPLRDASVSRLS